MAETWPTGAPWATDYREHALQLMKYLLETRGIIDRNKSSAVPAEVVKMLIQGTTTFLAKAQNVPDMSTVQDTLRTMRGDVKAAKEETSQKIEALKKELRSTNTQIERITVVGEETRGAAKEAAEMGKVGVTMIREVKNNGLQNNKSTPISYAAAAAAASAGGSLANSIHSPHNTQTVSTQSQREIIVNIRNPVTTDRLRAMNPRNLKSHVDHAIEQSSNEQIRQVKVMSANQLKSGDLIIRTTSISETQTLRQHGVDWAPQIGNGATVRVPTYGVIVHGIRTRSIDMDKLEENREAILMENRPFIPRAEIKYIGWLTRNGAKKSTTSIIIEFARPEDANKIVSEGLVWHGELCQSERYDRQCRLKQCFNCQKYGHIGTQCKATTTCGYCAQEHQSRECPSKSERNGPRKCAMCHGEHEAWSQQCSTRQEEIARAKASYATRAPFYPVPVEAATGTTFGGAVALLRRKRSARNLSQQEEDRPQGASGTTAIGHKRTNIGTAPTSLDKENEPPAGLGSQRPQRAHHPTRKALESLHVNAATSSISNQMDIDVDSDS